MWLIRPKKVTSGFQVTKVTILTEFGDSHFVYKILTLWLFNSKLWLCAAVFPEMWPNSSYTHDISVTMRAGPCQQRAPRIVRPALCLLCAFTAVAKEQHWIRCACRACLLACRQKVPLENLGCSFQFEATAGSKFDEIASRTATNLRPNLETRVSSFSGLPIFVASYLLVPIEIHRNFIV